MKQKFLKVFWVFLVALSSFTLGYTLKPSAVKRSMPPFMSSQTGGGQFSMPSGRSAPPLTFPGK